VNRLSPSTRSTYLTDFAHWLRWCREQQLHLSPAGTPDAYAPTALQLALYLAKRSAGGNAGSTINNKRTAVVTLINTIADLAGQPRPSALSNNLAVSSVVVSARRAKPMTPTIFNRRPWSTDAFLSALAVQFGDNDTLSIEKLRNKAIALVSLATLLRSGSVARIHPASIIIGSDTIEFRVSGGKRANLTGRPETLSRRYVLHATGTAVCPVAALRTYLDRVPPDHGEQLGIFCSAHRGTPTPLSSQRISAIRAQMLRHCGVQDTGHSFRRAAATALVAAGVPVETVARIGEWRSIHTMERYYVEDPLVLRGADALLRRTLPVA